MKKRKFSLKKSLLVGTVGATIAAGSLLWVTFGNGNRMQLPSHTVTEIVDGDTFFTEERVLVRLASNDAPEMGRCGAIEAKKALEKMILGKQVYIHVLYVDNAKRIDSQVYTKDGWVNREMLRLGYSSYPRSTPEFREELQSAVSDAREHKRGIHGETCTQMVNKENPDCNIKGNVKRDAKTYFRPGCGQYNQTGVQLYLGDQWFCTEQQARSAGFKPSQSCE